MAFQKKTTYVRDAELSPVLQRAKVTFATLRPNPEPPHGLAGRGVDPRTVAGETPGSKMEQLEELLRQYHLYQIGVDYPCGLYNYCPICPGGANCCARSLLKNRFLRI